MDLSLQSPMQSHFLCSFAFEYWFVFNTQIVFDHGTQTKLYILKLKSKCKMVLWTKETKMELFFVAKVLCDTHETILNHFLKPMHERSHFVWINSLHSFSFSLTVTALDFHDDNLAKRLSYTTSVHFFLLVFIKNVKIQMKLWRKDI